jgi:hypothetical protein
MFSFKHPKDVCMSYLEHMKFSLYLSYMFGKASFCALIHAIYPDILITTSSDTINKLTFEMKQIGCR